MMKLSSTNRPAIAAFFGRLFNFNTALKLYHWQVTGKGNYAQHIAIDQALESLHTDMDRLVETTFALYGELDIQVPEAKAPENIVKHAQDFYNVITKERTLFEEHFSRSILDDLQESLQQLLYRLLKTKYIL